MYWADELIQQLDKNKRHRVDDMKTPSGHAHAGSIRAISTHGLVYEALKNAGYEADFTYVINDMDPMDGLPRYLDESEYAQHMGKPLYTIPAPDGTSENFALQYANEYIAAFNRLGFKPEIFRSTAVYKEGKIDKYIKLSLDNVEKIRKIYKDVADQDKPEGWFPFQVICPECGKVGSSLVTDWDGEVVTFECKPDLVTWSKGCGATGKVSPFGGTGKLMWKVDWAAHWAALGITVEGAGKDHFSQGGSRYISAAITEQVFELDPPFGFLHEFLLIGGAKMSSSKGNAMSAKEFSESLPPELGRFLNVRTPYQRAINFDPGQSNTIPDLFDEYDRCAKHYFETGTETDYGRYFEAAQLTVPSETELFLPRFRQVATLIQMPSVDVYEYFASDKGSKLTKTEIQLLEERAEYAQLWLDNFADESEKYVISEQVPAEVADLDPDQKQFLLDLAEVIKKQDYSDANELQQTIFELAKSSAAKVKDCFAAIYLALYGRTHGPRAGWVIEAEVKKDSDFVPQRLIAAAKGETTQGSEQFRYDTINIPQKLSITDAVKEKWPTLTVAYAEIKGVTIKKSDPKLEELKNEYLAKLATISRDDLNSSPAITSYRKLYKETGIDWHSRRPSPEALLRRLTQGKDLYTVNTCVDAYNLAVMNNMVSIGAFNLDKLSMPTKLQIAEGNEEITLLMDDSPTEIKQGELCYFDQEGPYNLDFNYRDADRTKVTLDTTNLMINVEGVYDISRADVEKTLEEAVDLITRFCGGVVETIGVIE